MTGIPDGVGMALKSGEAGEGAPQGGQRLPTIDIARGVAVLAMVAYHFSWDLWAFRLIAADLLHDPLWLLARTVICSSFLFIAGLCAGLPVRSEIAAVWRRFQRVAGAAALVSVATWNVFPDSWIFFGVLHHLALAGVLAWGLRWVSPPLLAAAGVLIAGVGFSDSPGFDALNQPWLRWVGMGSISPESNDYVPLLPWFGMFLLGLAVGRFRSGQPVVFGKSAGGPVFGGVAWLGRHSLAIYLLHQPVLYGAVWVFVMLSPIPAGPMNIGADATFMGACTDSCVAQGRSHEACTLSCRCSVTGLKRENLWEPLLYSRLTPSQAGRAEGIIDACTDGAVGKR